MRETSRQRVADGSHNFLGGEIQREMNRQRVADGTHPFLGGEIQCQRVADGTHPFLGGEISRETNRQRVADGSHNFLGESNPSSQRVADGSHHLLRHNNPNARPEYEQARLFYFTCVEPMGTNMTEKRKQLYAEFSDIPGGTIRRWIRKWQSEITAPE